MKTQPYLFFIVLLLFFIEGNAFPIRQGTKELSHTSKNKLNVFKTNKGSLKVLTSDCPRGQAQPTLKKSVYPQTNFILLADSISAIETITFDNGDRLIIKNWGCEYYVLTFRFETSKYQEDTANLAYWYKAAGQLMTRMLAGIEAPMNIKRGLVFLESYALRDKKNKYKNLKLKEEIYFDGKEIKSFVTLDRIEKLTDKKYAVTISFATGPL